jgi:D-3-phosphoglycerate dehydrogenase
MTKKVLVSDPITDPGIDLLEENGVEVTYNTELSYDELLEEIGKYNGIILRSMTPLNEEVLGKSDNLEVIARAGSGYDNIDIDAASKNGIIVLNTPGENTVSAAEQAMALMLASSRNTVQANNSVNKGVWDRNKYIGAEVNGKTLGIIGLGRVGSNVAQRAQAFNMEVIANDPYIPEERGERLGVELVSKDELYRRSDYVTIHTPLTDETEHLLNADSFAKMKDGVYIINAARGGCVDRFDLEEAVNSGKVAGAGLDVHEEEPPGKDYNLIDVEEVILAPHLGGTTVAAMDNVALEAAKQALMVFNDELPRTPLNVPRLQPEELKQVQPYINLAEKLGGFYAGWESSRIKEVEVIYRGEIANKETELVTPAVLKGLLDPVVEEELNLVNADVFAEKRGIKVVETTSSSSDEFANLVTLKINDGETTKQLSGTIFHNEGIRIVDIDGYDVDVIPEGNLLVTAHSDQPGIVGKVGTLLGNNDINIASMQLGRNQAGGKAIMIINIDQQLDEQLTEDLLEIDGMNDFSLLNL